MARPKRFDICPLGGAGVGGMLQTYIWFHLLTGPRRFGEVQRLIPQASRQMLTTQLRDLERLGAVHREVFAELPPRVEYSLTDLGQTSGLAVRQFVAWGEWFCEQMGLDFDEWLVRMGTRWKTWIWFQLFSGPQRFGALQQALPGISRQSLALELRELQGMRALERRIAADDPTRVEYALTDPAQRSEPILRQMYTWGRWYCEQAGIAFDWPAYPPLTDSAAHEATRHSA
jgi:DNA-binding HxlR family transcriptional regulator